MMLNDGFIILAEDERDGGFGVRGTCLKLWDGQETCPGSIKYQ